MPNEVAEQHRRAAVAAEDATNWQDAVAEYEACLSIVSQQPDSAGQDEVALLTGLGRCYWNLSEARTAWRTLRRAIALAKDRGDDVAHARAAVEILRIWGPPDRHRAITEEALAALGDKDPYLRARLLLNFRWQQEDPQPAFEEALAIAEEHGFNDIIASRVQEEAWELYEAGDIDKSVNLFEQAHEAYASQHVYDPAVGVLRGIGFNLMEIGQLDRGYALAERAFHYASSAHLLFSAQLALMDMIGVAFSRGEFDLCEELLAASPSNSDFRGDCYRMWIAEERGERDEALGLMVDPSRGGNTPTAVGQIHASSAGVLYRSGNLNAAQQALDAWHAVERPNDGPYWEESAAAAECILALGSRELHQRIYDAFRHRDERVKAPPKYSTLQGRALALIRGGLCLKLGLVDEAEHHYKEGLAWCEQEGLDRDAERCRSGLAEAEAARTS